MHCLAKDPDQRPPAGLALLASLNAFATDPVDGARASLRGEHRREVVLGVMVLLVVAAVILLLVALT
jgi:hypothetical protein